MTKKIQILGIPNIPLIKKDDDIAHIILNRCKKENFTIEDEDIILIAQTVITKSLGRIRDLSESAPDQEAYKIYNKIKHLCEARKISIKPPELIQAILEESKAILKTEHVLITETKHGFVCANAGIDKSNIEGKTKIGLLPKDPDKEARNIRDKIQKQTGKKIAVIITDSFGRPFRKGSVGVALGVAGISPLKDQRGKKDIYGHILQSTIIGQADNLASAAQLVMGESDEGIPISIIRGYSFDYNRNAVISKILREPETDLFRDNIEYSFEQLLKNRRSYKLEYSKKKVERSTIENALALSRWAPSAHNAQPWRYAILERGKTRERLIDEMNKKLKSDLQKDGKTERQIQKEIKKTRNNFLKSPFLILLCLDRESLETYPDKERKKNEYLLGVQGISAAATYLLLSFEMMGLSTCWYCAPLFAKAVVREVLDLPNELDPMAFFTVGYGKKNTKTNPPFRKKLNNIIIEVGGSK
jgi:coenzyme F420-0:L-glutamate ligase/coenzyme F420-1:gamma-L-glutamate ligase